MEITIDKLEKMSVDDLIKLNKDVVNIIKSKRSKEAVKNIQKYCVGCVVSFNGKKGTTQTGIVTRINKKTIDVLADHVIYRVPVSIIL